MKSFFRKNPTITFGLGLPLLLTVALLIVSGIPNLMVAPPKYDVLYTTGHNYNTEQIKISVIDEKVQVVYIANKNDKSSNNTKRRMWRYNAQTGAVKEIPISLPSTEPRSNHVTISVPEVAKLTIDSSSIAPDGYEFSNTLNRSSRGLIGSLFYSNKYQDNALLVKNGRSVRIPIADQQYYYRNDIKMVGWVVAE